MIAMGNVGGAEDVAVARERLDDDSPLVRGAAVWALSRLLGEQSFQALCAERSAQERDSDVLAEWDAGASVVPASGPAD